MKDYIPPNFMSDAFNCPHCGAIANTGNCTINNCTFSDNKANNGGAIYNYLGNLSVNVLHSLITMQLKMEEPFPI